MGLAAGQARLLTITARKSDCEFRSMGLSHQKISLARQLADLSNEYQNSLDQSKLIYDYYGTGDTTTPLSYNILMTPSALNDYMPTTITDTLGRVVLNSKYASVARYAGIPQEGLGTLPSEAMRNAFIQGLASKGVITNVLASTILGLPYNQEAGFGGGTTVSVLTEDVNINELAEILSDYTVTPLDTSYDAEFTRGINLYSNSDSTYYVNSASSGDGRWNNLNGKTYTEGAASTAISLGQILQGDYVMVAYGQDEYNSALGYAGGAIDAVVNSSFWEDMFEAVESLLDTGDSYTQKALEYARSNVEKMISNNCDQSKGPGSKGCEDEKRQYYNDTDLSNFAYRTGGADQEKDANVMAQALNYASENGQNNSYIGLVCRFNCGKGHDDDSDISAVSVNLSNVLKAYLTYFADFMNGVSATDAYGMQIYDVTNQKVSSKLVSDDYLFQFKIKTGTTVSSDDLAQATFYDALFNQICKQGWSENEKITESGYMQAMLQNGMLFISKMKDDGYYYQGNYATDPYIKEISDETAIAQAESRYTTEKAKLNTKEETLDLKMKNLDTEISSLTTEYDTVKNTISKNIEKSFKRYSA